jgi:hypothetical protein
VWGQGNIGKGLGAGEFILNQAPNWPQGYGHWAGGWEICMVRFLEREGYDCKYFDNTDLNRSGSYLAKSKVMISMGHDEYWSRRMVEHVHTARQNGMSFVFAGANDAYWECRWEDDPYGQLDRALVCYKYEADPWYNLPGNGPAPVNAAGQPFTTFRNIMWARHGASWALADAVKMFEGNFQGAGYVGDPYQGPIQVINFDHWAMTGATVPNGAPTGFNSANDLIPWACGYEVDMTRFMTVVLTPDWRPANLEVLASTAVTLTNSDDRFPGAVVGSVVGTGHPSWQNMAISGGQGGLGYVFSTGSMAFNWALDNFGSQWGPDIRPVVEGSGANGAKQLLRNILNKMKA